jgi:hypothetical protein
MIVVLGIQGKGFEDNQATLRGYTACRYPRTLLKQTVETGNPRCSFLDLKYHDNV